MMKPKKDISLGTVKRYEDCIIRLGNWGFMPPTREYVDEAVDLLVKAKVDSWWYSVVDGRGLALFPSKAYPKHHPGATLEGFQYLTRKAHQAGLNVISWIPLNAAASITDVHPDWRIRFYDFKYPLDEDAKRYPCFNSPYTGHLIELSKEIVGLLGFDGIWFDGATFSCHDSSAYQPGCFCEFCKKRFRKETGMVLPERIDWESRTFRLWVNWRYEILMEVWEKLVDAVKSTNPKATVCLNNYRRRFPLETVFLDWNTAIPLRDIGLDALLSTEFDIFYGQADIQMKVNRAMGFTRGLESWWGQNEHSGPFRPGMDILTQQQAALGVLSAGGMPSYGGILRYAHIGKSLEKIKEVLEPGFKYEKGEPVRYSAILVSQQTMDFHGKENPRSQWDAVHGANELMQHSGLLTDVVFDCHINNGQINRYPLLIIGNMVCLSMKQAKALQEYVKKGGVLVTAFRCGEKDELGYRHQCNLLDDLAGIKERKAEGKFCIWKIINKKYQVDEDNYVTPFPDSVAPYLDVIPAGDVEVICLVATDSLAPFEKDWFKTVGSPGAWVKRLGKGKVVYFNTDIFEGYIKAPTVTFRDFYRKLMVSLAPPAISLEPSLAVTINARQDKNGQIFIHVHNNPGPTYRYPEKCGKSSMVVGEVISVHDLKVYVKGIKRAYSGITGERFRVSGDTIKIPKLKLHDMILVK